MHCISAECLKVELLYALPQPTDDFNSKARALRLLAVSINRLVLKMPMY
jgi:hypothetical protein